MDLFLFFLIFHPVMPTLFVGDAFFPHGIKLASLIKIRCQQVCVSVSVSPIWFQWSRSLFMPTDSCCHDCSYVMEAYGSWCLWKCLSYIGLFLLCIFFNYSIFSSFLFFKWLWWIVLVFLFEMLWIYRMLLVIFSFLLWLSYVSKYMGDLSSFCCHL